MAKTLENLTMAEQEILQGFMDAFGCTEAEALDMALTDGAIKEVTGGGLRYAPEGYKELKFYTMHPKAHIYLCNKALNKAKMDKLCEEDTFVFDVSLPKDDKGNYKLDEVRLTDLGQNPEVIVTGIYYKGVRSKFDAQNNPEPTNFETALAKSLSKAHQAEMLIMGSEEKGKSMLKLREEQKAKYKSLENVPPKLKAGFKVVLYGLVKVGDTWERFYYETTPRNEEDKKIEYIFEKVTAGKIIKTKYISKLIQNGTDAHNNPTFQLDEIIDMPVAEFDTLKGEIKSAYDALIEFKKAQVEYAKSDISSVADSKPQAEDIDDSDEDPFAK